VLVDGMLWEGGRNKNTCKQKKVARSFIPMTLYLIIYYGGLLYYSFSKGNQRGQGFEKGKGGGQGLCKIP
jgi:hypothetical protein